MFKILPMLVLGFIACTWALPINEDERKPENVEILKSEINKYSDGSYGVDNLSSDGTGRMENAKFQYTEDGKPVLEVEGSYTYLNEFGETVEVHYTAGVNGFVPRGNFIHKDISDVAEAAKDLPKYEELLQNAAQST
ncbi:endocuticle structural glycoprotein SgAbd-9 [Drosophila innubila]|uniref:endocuticle structural glycoprotein SgAbd-9 n=1 Tax=Drosophila innubila TaxID=198719 RepID=UPI00148B451B|nr:endocuticle structural glycoprotein SgAbd-9 [Drosophila innubila]